MRRDAQRAPRSARARPLRIGCWSVFRRCPRGRQEPRSATATATTCRAAASVPCSRRSSRRARASSLPPVEALPGAATPDHHLHPVVHDAPARAEERARSQRSRRPWRPWRPLCGLGVRSGPHAEAAKGGREGRKGRVEHRSVARRRDRSEADGRSGLMRCAPRRMTLQSFARLAQLGLRSGRASNDRGALCATPRPLGALRVNPFSSCPPSSCIPQRFEETVTCSRDPAGARPAGPRAAPCRTGRGRRPRRPAPAA
jgi:hypothetical protein